MMIAASAPSSSQVASAQKDLGVVAPGDLLTREPRAELTSAYSQFVDPVGGMTADDLVRYALRNNGELAAARQMIAQARCRLRQAGLKANPMIEASGARALNMPDNSVMFTAELPLELKGRRAARVAVAERELEIREAEVADFERKLAAEVRMKYAAALAAARNLGFTENLLTLTRDSHRLVRARVERGSSPPLEQNLVLVELNRVDAMRISFDSRVQVAMLELKKVIGMPPDEPLRLRGVFTIDRQLPARSDALREALARRPDLAAARAAEQLALAQLEQARVEGKVDASLFAGYQRMSSGFDVHGFDESGALVPVHGIFHFATFGVKLMLPVRNKNQGEIDTAVAAIEASRSRRRFAELVVRNEVAAAFARWERAEAALAVYRDGVHEQAVRNLDVVRQTYVLGGKSLIDYTEEQRRFIDVQTGYTEVLKEYFESLVEIERAAGSPLPAA